MRRGPDRVRGAQARDADDKPLLLLIGSKGRLYREYIVRSVAGRYRLWLLQPEPVTWERPYIAGATAVDTDPEPLVAAARAVADREPVAGVFCYDEALVWPAAFVAQALGLPGSGPEAVAACRDKRRTRAALAEAGVSQPSSLAVASLAEAVAAAEHIGYPVVLKPRGLGGSMGVQRAARRAELESAYEAARAAEYPGVPVYDTGVLVEQCVDGPEISVDAVFYDGECTPLAVARKQVGFEPFFEEVGHLVDAADPLLSDPGLLDSLEHSHKALGFTDGVTHTEFRLTPAGPSLMEVNARLGGDMIPFLGHLATGVDIGLAAADVAAGARPRTRQGPRRCAGVAFLYPDEDVEVESVTIDAAAYRETIHSATPLVEPGDVLRLPPRGYVSRYGRVIAVADTMGEVEEALAHAHDIVRLDARPVRH